jgi:hypothetical protein
LERKYDAFINVILTLDKEDNGGEYMAGKESHDVTIEGLEEKNPSNPIDLDTES